MNRFFVLSIFFLVLIASTNAQTVHTFYVMDQSTQGYQQFETITVNVGDQVMFYNGTGGTYNFYVVDQNNFPEFEEPGVPNGQLIYSVVIDQNYPSSNYIRVEEYVFNPMRIKEVEIVKNTASLSDESIEASVYPNPATDKLFIDLAFPVKELTVISISGEVISTHLNTNEISLDHLDHGVFLIVGKLEDGSIFERKIIKK